jgi:preprotein translocase subunit SecA
LDNAFYSVAEGLVTSFKLQNDFEGFKLAAIVNFGIDSDINSEDFNRQNEQVLAEQLYQQAITNYQRKKDEIATNAVPIFKNIKKEQGKQIENVIVPFTDGKRSLQILANMDKTIETEGYEMLNSVEKTVTLNFIDDEWKEHLRAMDDLKQSVQTATYEQKDPLVIYKVEAFTLFKNMDAEVNKNIVEFLCHATIPGEDGEQVKEGKQEKTDLSKMKTRKDIDSAGQEVPPTEEDFIDPTPVKQQPVIVGPKTGRNDPCPCGSGKKFKACHGRE